MGRAERRELSKSSQPLSQPVPWDRNPSEGVPRLAYLGPGAGWDGGREDFKNSRRSARPIRALVPGPKIWKIENHKNAFRLRTKSTDLPEGADRFVSSRRYDSSDFRPWGHPRLNQK